MYNYAKIESYVEEDKIDEAVLMLTYNILTKV